MIALEQTYPRKIFPSVWNSPVSKWFQANTPDTCIIQPDEQELQELGEVANWAQNLREPKYRAAAVDDFFKVADSWLVASAKRYNCVIVTNEKPAPKSIAKVKIPDAAAYSIYKYDWDVSAPRLGVLVAGH